MGITFIGLGLSDEKDITIKGLEAVKNASFVFLEHYTSTLNVNVERMEEFYGRKLILTDRETVEEAVEDEILDKAEEGDVAFLVVGDPFCATTHGDTYLRAIRRGIKVKVIHNSSIINAVACCGLQIYRFGETVSIPFFMDNWKPGSFYKKILSNLAANLHTLCLLDIKVKEQKIENMMKRNKIYEPPRFMSIAVAIEQLLELEKLEGAGAISESSLGVGIARIGAEDQVIKTGTLGELKKMEFGPPLHSLVICAPKLHEIEEEFFSILQNPFPSF